MPESSFSKGETHKQCKWECLVTEITCVCLQSSCDIRITFTLFPRSAARMPEGLGKPGVFLPYLRAGKEKDSMLLVMW